MCGGGGGGGKFVVCLLLLRRATTELAGWNGVQGSVDKVYVAVSYLVAHLGRKPIFLQV